MRKIIAFLLCVISVTMLIPLSVSSSSFTDVPDGKWYSEGIEFCYQNGYMAGVSEGVFDRNGNLTRSMFVTILAGLDKADTSKHANASHFTDVAAGKWYSGAVNWAFENGLASGIGEGTFGYKNPVTREQIAVFMLAYAEFSNATHPERNPFDITVKADLSGYDDAARIHDWAFDALSWAVASGLISGTSDTTLDPRGFCTRAQAAVIIHSFMRDIEKKECEHVWVAPDCTNDGYCSVCNENGEAALGHIWVDPDCENDGYCSRCNEKGEPALGHVWISPDCLSDGYCSVCGEKSGSAVGHDWIAPDCENDGYCSRCNEKGESALGHVWISPDCENDGYCSRCNEKGESALGHNYLIDEDDTQFKTCEYCGDMTCATEHRWIDATCTKDGYCALCKDFYESATGHKVDEYDTCIRCGGEYDPIAGCFHEWILPDCYNDGYCTVCGMKGEISDGHEFEDYECLGCGMKICKHNWVPANCGNPVHCSLCGEDDPESKPLGHDYSSGNIGCKRCGVYHIPALSAFSNLLHNLAMRATDLSDSRKGFAFNFDDRQTKTTSSLYIITNDLQTAYSSLEAYTAKTGNRLSVVLVISDKAGDFNLKIESVTNDVSDFSLSATLNLESGVTVTDVGFSGGHSDAELLEIAESAAAMIVNSTEKLLRTHTNLTLSALA